MESLIEQHEKIYAQALKSIKIVEPCEMCGLCCKVSTIRITLPEVIQILKYTKKEFNEIFTIDPILNAIEIRKNGNSCIFLKNGKCQIYQIRPLQCISYPILFVSFYKELPTFRHTKESFAYFKCEGEGCIYKIKLKKLNKLVQLKHAYLTVFAGWKPRLKGRTFFILPSKKNKRRVRE